jgi:hypothetical protein
MMVFCMARQFASNASNGAIIFWTLALCIACDPPRLDGRDALFFFQRGVWLTEPADIAGENSPALLGSAWREASSPFLAMTPLRSLIQQIMQGEVQYDADIAAWSFGDGTPYFVRVRNDVSEELDTGCDFKDHSSSFVSDQIEVTMTQQGAFIYGERAIKTGDRSWSGLALVDVRAFTGDAGIRHDVGFIEICYEVTELSLSVRTEWFISRAEREARLGASLGVFEWVSDHRGVRFETDAIRQFVPAADEKTFSIWRGSLVASWIVASGAAQMTVVDSRSGNMIDIEECWDMEGTTYFSGPSVPFLPASQGQRSSCIEALNNL